MAPPPLEIFPETLDPPLGIFNPCASMGVSLHGTIVYLNLDLVILVESSASLLLTPFLNLRLLWICGFGIEQSSTLT